VVLENEGRATPARTLPFLIGSDLDERRFEYYATSELAEVMLDGAVRPLLPPGVVTGVNVSPDGRYLLVERVHPPWSRSLGLDGFPLEILVVDREGRLCHRVADLPPAEEVPITFDSVRPGPRSVHWRAEQPATLCWVEALDGGDASCAAAERDALLELPAPFTASPRRLALFQDRFNALIWGRADLALAWESWHKERRERVWRLDPAAGTKTLLLERDSDDAWSEPGWPQTTRNALGRSVLRCSPDGAWIYWAGRGADARGVHPFLDRMRVADGRRQRLWSCRDPWFETLLEMLDDEGHRLLVRRESLAEPDNAWLLDRPRGRGARERGTADHRARRVTQNEDPAPMLAGMQKELLHYKRADGVELTAMLHLPPGYRRGVDPPLPALLWAYPREFKSREAAGRSTSSPFTFSRPAGTSPLFLLTQGYAVVTDPSMPILGAGDAEPNDRFLDELEADARAVVDCLGGLGVIDTTRLAIGGHSYGAFMAANLAAHTGLFRAAICCSGAYNRTLTPFGFQGEDRSLWQAPATYLAMSPFLAADRVNTPILLIHGSADPNSGTFPLQSDRFYDALKGLGATTRLVRLPAEGHGYRARESVGQVLWEMANWCDIWLRPAAGGPGSGSAETAPATGGSGGGTGR
jgi:dipeptidyl aminopeptidase/acylaminoacyl peptidase